MRNFTLKILMIACIVFFAGYSEAQFRIGNASNVGGILTTDGATGINELVTTFNTSRGLSSATLKDDGTYSISISKCRNEKGFQVNVYNEADAAVVNGDFKCYRYGSNENPVHVASVASLESILDAYAVNDPATTTSKLMPSHCLFDITADNMAFGAHPGKYKRVEYGFYFKLEGYSVTDDEDITFDIITYDEGVGLNGATASYELSVYIGGDQAGNLVATVPDFYETGSGTKSVKLAEATGLVPSQWSNKKVYFFLKTTGSGTAIADDVRDPIIVIDNVAAKFNSPLWKEPAAMANEIVNNQANVLEGNIKEETIFGVALKTEGRLGTLKIVDNLYSNGQGNKSFKDLTFLETGAVKANDGNGNYTVDVPYTLTPAVFNETKMEWSSQNIVIGAPTGAVNDDLMFYFKATPMSFIAKSARLELDCGTRIFYDVYFKALEKVLYFGANPSDNILPSDSALIANLEAAGQIVVYMDDNDAVATFDYSPYAVAVFGESCSSSRVVPFGTDSKYPIPSVMLEPLGPRYNKWGWWDQASDPNIYKDDASASKNWNYIRVTNDHYITSDIGNGKAFKFTDAPIGTNTHVYGVDLKSVVPQAIGIGRNATLADPFRTVWAIPKGATLGITGETLPNRMVYIGLHAFTLADDDSGSAAFGTISATSKFMGMFVKAVEWALGNGVDGVDHAVADEEILYLGNGKSLSTSHSSDIATVGQLSATGYSITYMDRQVINPGANDGIDQRFDYSPYAAIVFGSACGSSDLGPFAQDGYPLPAVSLKADGPRSDKWGWVNKNDATLWKDKKLSDYVPVVADRTDGLKMVIANNKHYITKGYYANGQYITWTGANPETLDFSKVTLPGLNLLAAIPSADPLTYYLGAATSGLYNSWAVEAGSTVNSLQLDNSYATVSLPGRIVILGIHSDAAPFVNNDFGFLLGRSVEWVLGANLTAVSETTLADADILVYPNPASAFAKVKFVVDKPSEVSLSLYSLLGQNIQITSKQRFERGVNEIEINTSRLNEGIYFYQLKIGTSTFTGKFNVTK